VCSHLVPNCFNDGGILEYALHRCPTHIRSRNYCHRMCICQATTTEKSLKLTFIRPGSRFDCLYTLNWFKNASMMLVFWIVLCRMRICQVIAIQKSLKLTFIHPGWRFDCFCAVILCQTSSMMLVFWIMLYTGTPHTFGLPTTAITFVFVKKQTPKQSSNCRLYTRARYLTVFTLSSCAKLLQ
jgi:hypothetical protein